jgi:hypothetical protein
MFLGISLSRLVTQSGRVTLREITPRPTLKKNCINKGCDGEDLPIVPSVACKALVGNVNILTILYSTPN